jgi:hypothetical protein
MTTTILNMLPARIEHDLSHAEEQRHTANTLYMYVSDLKDVVEALRAEGLHITQVPLEMTREHAQKSGSFQYRWHLDYGRGVVARSEGSYFFMRDAVREGLQALLADAAFTASSGALVSAEGDVAEALTSLRSDLLGMADSASEQEREAKERMFPTHNATRYRLQAQRDAYTEAAMRVGDVLANLGLAAVVEQTRAADDAEENHRAETL